MVWRLQEVIVWMCAGYDAAGAESDVKVWDVWKKKCTLSSYKESTESSLSDLEVSHTMTLCLFTRRATSCVRE